MKDLHKSRTMYLAVGSVFLSAVLAVLASQPAGTLPEWLLPVLNSFNAGLAAVVAMLRVGDKRKSP